MPDALDLLKALDAERLTRLPDLVRLDQYYEGEQPLKFMAPALKKEFGERITELVINWPQLVADAFETRLDIEGFRYRGNAKVDDALEDVWQANDLDEQAQQSHLEAIALRRAYIIVGTNPDDAELPFVTVESPMQVWARRDPRTRRVSAAIKRWSAEDGTKTIEHATLYTPNETSSWVKGSKGWELTEAPDEHQLGRPPVVPLVNRPRILRPDGRSEYQSVIPLADAANKMATDMMTSGEFHAMPRRWVAGMKQEEFVDEHGNALNPWARDAGTVWASENKDMKAGQFQESDLQNFHNTIKLLAQLTGHLAALPPHYMGFGSENPPSAEAIKSAEIQLVKKAERMQTYFGGAWEDVCRLILRFRTGTDDPEARRLETVWRDPSTPTEAQKADATVKKVDAGVITVSQAREDLGYTPEQRARMAEEDADPVLERLTRDLARNDVGVTGDAASRGR
ncbi:MAG: phage portal protein [Dietzia sp.]